MSIELYRIDDRLVHGQVMVAWSKIYRTTNIIIADDETASNRFICEVMKMAVPRDYSVQILTMSDAIEKINGDPPGNRTMVIAKGPRAALDLIEGGVSMKELNVGNMGAGPRRKAVMRSIQLDPEELETFKKIAQKGVRVYFQIIPDGRSVELDKIRL